MKYDDFLKKARETHGDKYNYVKFDDIAVSKKIKIICPIHGEFEQVIYAHLRGQGCPKCVGKRRGYKTEDFIRDAKEKFGNRFDYSKTIYTGRRNKVCIICKELMSENNPTGEFWQKPFTHLASTTGMPFTGKRGKKYNSITDRKSIELKTLEFIEKAKNIHGDKYDYSKSNYVGCNQKICIICPIHGEFWQTPSNHLKGCGCSKCARISKITIGEFIKKANKRHNNKYDYTLNNELKESEKIKIICPIHGEFEQYYHHHLQGHGCPLCSNNKKYTIEEFIKKAREIHGNKYDYSKIKYINNHTPICIICPKHGEFWQTPSSHLNNCGCPLCNESKLENEISLFLKRNGILYERQKEYDKIKFKDKLPFDFYLPEYNAVIECQGIQHFEKSHFFKDAYRFEKDKIKYNGCIKNKIKILYYTNIKKYKQYFNEIYSENNLFSSKNKLLKEIKKG